MCKDVSVVRDMILPMFLLTYYFGSGTPVLIWNLCYGFFLTVFGVSVSHLRDHGTCSCHAVPIGT